MPDVWQIFSNQLYFISIAFDVRIHAFVLMSNHFHMLLATPLANLSEAMCHFMRETSKELTTRSNRLNQTWGARHRASLIGGYNYYQQAYKYIYRNPVSAGIETKVEDYKYSSLRGLLGKEHLGFPVYDLQLTCDVENTLEWLNYSPKEEDRLMVGRALRRQIYSLKTSNGQLRSNTIEDY